MCLQLTDEETPGNRGLSLFPGVFGQKLVTSVVNLRWHMVDIAS